jgi:signal transduction histidine kinase/ActR/RegA family two-component response regulator
MTNIARWAEHPVPIDATDTIGSVRRRFLDEPALCALPVMDGASPLGVALREVVLAVADDPMTCEAPISRLAARMRALDARAPAEEALAVLTTEGGCAEPIMLLDDGRYAGLLTQQSLAKALSASEPRPQGGASEDHRRFVEMLGRELRTPMTGVLAVTELLQRQPLTSDAQAYVQTIIHTAETVVRLLDDALDLALGESGRLQPENKPVALRQAMDEVQADWQGGDRANVAVLVSYDGDPDLAVLADGGRLRQVFANLISAAVKTTRQGAVEASLKARVLADGVRLEGRVRDAGPGLPPEQLALIFDPMSSQDGARNGWSGLGPAVCRRIVEAMHGSIRAESNVGEGVTVTFELMAPRLEEAARDELEGAQAGSGGGLHVLVVDDNATNRMVAEGLCEMFDCTSETAEDGVEAVEAARSGRFDLILMDIKMPRMDGVEATRQIRSLPAPIGQTPIIALTANADPEDAKTYIANGMSSVVEKPIKPERLLNAMNAALEGREARRGGSTQAA